MIDEIDDLEWQRQEQARQAERTGLADVGSDASARRYRHVARELAQDRDDPLPSNFAYAHSSRIEALARQRRLEQMRFAGSAFAWFFAIAGAGGFVGLVTYGGEWWSVLDRAGWLNSPALAWLVAVAGCGLLSWLLARTSRRGA